MKRKKTREILVEFETIRITRKRPAERKPEETKSSQEVPFETCNCADAFSKNRVRLEHLFDQLF